MTEKAVSERLVLVARALRLEYLTVGWNVVEGIIAITAALVAGSVALLGFGIDSFVESASGAILIWRLRAERGLRDAESIAALDLRARRGVGLSLLALSLFIAGDAVFTLIRAERPEASYVGIALTSLSLVVMVWLARAKRGAAHALGSRALEADAFQTSACWWLSLVTLGGIGLNALFGWWWADPVAALGMTCFLVREGKECFRRSESDPLGRSESDPPRGLSSYPLRPGLGRVSGVVSGCFSSEVAPRFFIL